jgi:DNA repair exonuclease SbcCD ATPase subunit
MALVQPMMENTHKDSSAYLNIGDEESKTSDRINSLKHASSHIRSLVTDVWAQLTRNDEGSEKNPVIPQVVNIKDHDEVYIGRIAVVDSKSKKAPHHEKQVMIPCPFVSGTHLSIRREVSSDEQQVKFYIHDYSRNGIFVNSKLVGIENKQELHDKDKIAFIFHGDVKICYDFHTVTRTTPSPQRLRADQAKDDQSMENSMNAMFTSQLSALKEEKAVLENRLSTVTSQVEEMTKEVHNLQRENKSISQTLSEREGDIKNLNHELADLVAHQSANEARIHHLTEQVEEHQQTKAELSSKLNLLTEELKYKSQELASRETMLESMYSELFQAKSSNLASEGTIANLEAELQELKADNAKVLQSNASYKRQVEHLQGKLVVFKVSYNHFSRS